MRPDQHKKKRTEQYKRKHGMGKDKSDKKEDTKDTSNSRRGQNNEMQEKSSPVPPHDGDTFNDGETSSSNHQQSFSRRTLQSNWEKYDDMEEAVSNARNYDDLLADASDPSAHMKQEHEKEWESFIDLSDKSIFNIDLDYIADTLCSAYSFSELHGLDSSNFDEDLIRIIDGGRHSAKSTEGKEVVSIDLNNLSKLASLTFSKPTQVKPKDDPDPVQVRNDAASPEPIIKTTPFKLDLQGNEPVISEYQTNDTPSEMLPPKNDVPVAQVVLLPKEAPKPSPIVAVKNDTKPENLELELDDLLDNQCTLQPSKGDKSIDKVSSTNNSLLSVNKTEAPLIATAINATDATDELDDWLDSII